MDIEFVRGDITEQHVDAVVNAANSSLLGGGGVDGAIHRRGGPEILAECKELRAGRYRDGLPTGDAVATTAGRLPARWVIHTVGPVWARREDRSALLESCYRRSLEVADELGADSLHYLSLQGVYEAVGVSRENHCDACFSGSYPLAGTEDARGKYALELPLVRA